MHDSDFPDVSSAKKLEDILKWLDSLNCAEKQQTTASLRQQDTCQWLFDTTQYKTWRDSESSFLWLRGKAGAGKSILASFVIDSLQASQRKGEILVFFYCVFRNKRSTNASEALRSILSQMLRQLHGGAVDPKLIDDLVKAKENGVAALNNAKVLARFISTIARLFPHKPLIVVDALDECKDVKALLDGLVSLKEDARLFVTSRPLQIIKDSLYYDSSISMDDMAEVLSADIKVYITQEFDSQPRLNLLSVELKTEIYSVLCREAYGMFRWLDELMEGISINLEKRTMDRDLGAIHGYALLDACGSLVTYAEETGIITLSHSAAKEYLTGEISRIVLPQYHINWEEAHLQLAQSCMCYISICLERVQESSGSGSTSADGSKRSDRHPMSQPLRAYALEHAFDHLRHVGPHIKSVLHDIKILAEDIHEHSMMRNDVPERSGNSWIPTHFCLLCRVFTNTPLSQVSVAQSRLFSSPQRCLQT
ncbi:hypothetical protein OG21DRAFT_1499908 [Imleria badia]|nr:hypothetical protein OG21DRAFT_1499908 [Imleria badia]